MPTNDDYSDDVATVTEAACAADDALPGRILEAVGQRLNACGCVLWQLADGADLEASPPLGRLFTLDSWFQAGRFLMHDLPVDGTGTGLVVQTQREKYHTSIQKTGGIRSPHGFLLRHDVDRMMSVPMQLVGTSQPRGALNVYRTRAQPDFSRDEQFRITRLAKVVPFLYQAARDRLGLLLLNDVEEIFRQAEANADSGAPTDDRQLGVLQQLSQRIEHRLNCFEVSIVLAIPQSGPEMFEVTVSNRNLPRKLYKCRRLSREWKYIGVDGSIARAESNRDSGPTGLTEYVLETRSPVRIPDLNAFKEDYPIINRDYPGIRWADTADIRTLIPKHLQLDESNEMPPLSFMAAPLVVGDELFGVIRCCAPLKGPYYFADRERRLLVLIATMVAQNLQTWRSRVQSSKENEAWNRLGDGVARLNQSLPKWLQQPSQTIRAMLDQTLTTAQDVIPQADLLGIRMPDREKHHLEYKATHGPAWFEGTQDEVRERRQHLFPLGRPYKSRGAEVFDVRQTMSIPNLIHDELFAGAHLVPNAKQVIIAPICAGAKSFGVLDIFSTSSEPFPLYAAAVARLLGEQLGQYLYLLGTVSELRSTLAQHRQFVEDLAHQIKGPASQAFKRANRQIAGIPDDKNQRAIRGLCRKTLRVALSMRVLADLAANKKIKPNRTPLSCDWLLRNLIEAADDTAQLIDPARQIQISVDRDSFLPGVVGRVLADRALLQQCVNNLLDNAAKYSYDCTTVNIHGGKTGGGRFHISVESQGLVLRGDQVKDCRSRGWRSDEAKWVTGEGSGIGLWIVDQLMAAHGGELIVEPTDKRGRTVVKLILPLEIAD